jgi:hypothetical protein
MSFNAAATISGVSRLQTSGLAAGAFVAVRALVSSSGASAARARANHIGADQPAAPANVEVLRKLRRENSFFISGAWATLLFIKRGRNRFLAGSAHGGIVGSGLRFVTLDHQHIKKPRVGSLLRPATRLTCFALREHPGSREHDNRNEILVGQS